MKNILLNYFDEHKNEMFSFLSELLKIDTQNYMSHGKEEQGQLFLEEYCRKCDLETDFYYPDDVDGLLSHEGYLPNRGTDKRPNVTAVMKGRSGRYKIHLAAHMDTMPIGNETDWSVPPLGGVIKDNKIWGRGASDDKFGIVSGIFVLKALKECGIELEDDIYVTSYADEEYGGGNGALAACIKYPSDVYINLDGGGMQVLPYGIGGRCATASTHIDKTLSSCAEIFEGLKILVEEFNKFGEKRFEELRKSPIFKGTPIEEDSYRLLSVSCGDNGLDLNSAKISFTYYTLKQQSQMEKELSVLSDALSKKLFEKGMVFDGIENISRFFHPVNPEKVPNDAEMFKKALEKTYMKKVDYAGGCLSDLSVISQYGGGIAFNTGLYRGFNEYGGPHQIDEYVDCDEFLAITKALALYLMEKSYNK